jgi:hypothetical protein
MALTVGLKKIYRMDVKGLDFILRQEPVSYTFNRLKCAEHIREYLSPEGRAAGPH